MTERTITHIFLWSNAFMTALAAAGLWRCDVWPKKVMMQKGRVIMQLIAGTVWCCLAAYVLWGK